MVNVGDYLLEMGLAETFVCGHKGQWKRFFIRPIRRLNVWIVYCAESIARIKLDAPFGNIGGGLWLYFQHKWQFRFHAFTHQKAECLTANTASANVGLNGKMLHIVKAVQMPQGDKSEKLLVVCNYFTKIEHPVLLVRHSQPSVCVATFGEREGTFVELYDRFSMYGYEWVK